MQKKILAFVLSVFMVSLFALPVLVSAQTNLDLGINYATYTGLGTKDVRQTVAQIINVALGLLGIVAVVIILVGGFEWMTAGGNEEKTGEARKRIIAGVVGLAIILSAYAIANFVVSSLMTATRQ
jgi:multidrug transporter EmrE-like cation transporter